MANKQESLGYVQHVQDVHPTLIQETTECPHLPLSIRGETEYRNQLDKVDMMATEGVLEPPRDAQHSHAGAQGRGQDNRGPQPLTTAPQGPSCRHCGRPLTGRKKTFCSDACRMRARRTQTLARLDELLHRISTDVADLRAELIGVEEVEP